MKRILSIFLIIVFVAGCEAPINEAHQRLLTEYGWTVKQLKEEEQFILETPEELLANFEASGVDFLRNYQGQQVTQFHYELKEKDIDKKNIQVFVVEKKGEVIGGYIILQSWDPGVFKLSNKDKLVDGKYVLP